MIYGQSSESNNASFTGWELLTGEVIANYRVNGLNPRVIPGDYVVWFSTAVLWSLRRVVQIGVTDVSIT